MRIDLHTHSAASDGTDTPAELVRAAAAAGLDVVALTDHDTTAGWAEAQAALVGLPRALTFLPGAELSCQITADDGAPISLHLLAYLFDPTEPALRAERARIRDDRLRRAELMTSRLADAGYPISWPDVVRLAGDARAVGRPHLADALVEVGVVGHRDEAFAELLSSSGPFYVPHAALDPVQAVRLVTAAGGVSVIAHPGAAARGRIVGDATIVAMTGAGLAGIEVDHRDHDQPTRAHLRELAAELGLLVTGASDYHGAGKQNRLGEHTTDPEVYEQLVAAAQGSPVRAPVRA